jgi:hypothetical protein
VCKAIVIFVDGLEGFCSGGATGWVMFCHALEGFDKLRIFALYDDTSQTGRDPIKKAVHCIRKIRKNLISLSRLTALIHLFQHFKSFLNIN